MTSVTLNGRKLLCSGVSVNGTKNIDVKPNANIDGPVEAQTLAYENLTLNINGIKFPFTTDYLEATNGYFRYEDLLTMYKATYDGTNAYSLKVNFGNNNTLLKGLDDTNTTDIPVVLKSFSMPINVEESRAGYMPEVSIVLKETK